MGGGGAVAVTLSLLVISVLALQRNRLALVALPDSQKTEHRDEGDGNICGFDHRLLQTWFAAAVAGVAQQVAAERHKRADAGRVGAAARLTSQPPAQQCALG